MNTQRGISTIAVIILVVVLAGGAYAVVNRNVLKSYFQTGDKPSQENRDSLDRPFETGDVPSAEKTVGDMPTESEFKNVIDSDTRAAAPKSAPTTKTTPVMNESPKNNARLSAAEAEKSVSFRWTPVVPKPQEPVTYRLKVWQLMQGQSGTQAMRSNQPIVTKDVSDITESSLSGIYTGPCRPPYLCDFIWSVSTVQSGKVTGESSPSTFSVTGSAEVLGTPPKETGTQAEVMTEVGSGGAR